MRRRLFMLLLYSVLMALAVFFVFPFYWLLSSSLKSKKGFAMVPPTFYPARVERREVTVPAADRLFRHGEETWLLLSRSRDRLKGTMDEAAPRGGYYIKIEGDRPTHLVRFFDPGDVTPVAAPDVGSITFADAAVHVLRPTGERVAVVARLVRQREAGYDELLFTKPADGAGEGLGIAVNVPHREVRQMHARWENYPETLKGPEATFGVRTRSGFLLFMRNSFFISIMAVIGQVLSSSMVAYAFSRIRFRGNAILFTLLLATLMVPVQVTLIPMFAIYKQLGWIDTFLPLIVPHFTAGAFNVFLLRQYMLTLPRELDEAAAIDGCGHWKTYFHVILPNCTAALIVVGLFTFVYTWQDVMGPLIYLDNPNYRTVTLGLEYFRSPYVDNRPLLMAGAVLAVLPVAVIFLLLQRFIMAGIATTGVKG